MCIRDSFYSAPEIGHLYKTTNHLVPSEQETPTGVVRTDCRCPLFYHHLHIPDSIVFCPASGRNNNKASLHLHLVLFLRILLPVIMHFAIWYILKAMFGANHHDRAEQCRCSCQQDST